MNSLKMGVCAICIVGSTFVYAQNSASGPATDQGGGQGLKPGDAGKSMGSAADAGAGKNASGQGTLMQKREKAMSPEGASGSASTGKVKQ